MTDLRPEEIEYLENGTEHTNGRCTACGHLEVLHNFHCCEFCRIPGCACEWGELKTEKKDAT